MEKFSSEIQHSSDELAHRNVSIPTLRNASQVNTREHPPIHTNSAPLMPSLTQVLSTPNMPSPPTAHINRSSVRGEHRETSRVPHPPLTKTNKNKNNHPAQPPLDLPKSLGTSSQATATGLPTSLATAAAVSSGAACKAGFAALPITPLRLRSSAARTHSPTSRS